MNDAWITLQCPDCQESWEANPGDLPAPGEQTRCEHCDTRRPTAELMKTNRDLDILQEFQED
ncbi:hypothetical protein ACKVMT_02710 [Halobacteriales archaeon Cl-PHB]